MQHGNPSATNSATPIQYNAFLIAALFYYAGAMFYQKGYIDVTLDVGTARYKKGGAIKWIGFMTSFFSTCALAFSMITA